MNVMIDTNVILDVLGKREPFYEQSEAVLMLAAKQKLSALITANTVTDIYYLLRKYIPNREEIKRALLALMEVLDVVEVSGTDCVKAFALPMTDYEDALLAHCAKRIKAHYIITRNTKDFAGSPVDAITPESFLKRFSPVNQR